MSNLASEIAVLAQSLQEYLMDEFLEKDHTWIYSSSKEPFEITPKAALLPVQQNYIPQRQLPPPIKKVSPYIQAKKEIKVEERPPAKATAPTVWMEKNKNSIEEKATHKDFASVKGILREKFPQFEIVEKIPSDQEAKSIANEWRQPKATKGSFALFINVRTTQQKEFIERFEQAILKQGGTIKKLSALEEATLGHTLITHREFQQQLPSSQSSILLEPLDTYLQLPETKRILWNAILNHLS